MVVGGVTSSSSGRSISSRTGGKVGLNDGLGVTGSSITGSVTGGGFTGVVIFTVGGILGTTTTGISSSGSGRSTSSRIGGKVGLNDGLGVSGSTTGGVTGTVVFIVGGFVIITGGVGFTTSGSSSGRSTSSSTDGKVGLKDGFGVTGSVSGVSGTIGYVGMVGGFVTIVGGTTTSGSGSGKSTVSRTGGRVGLNEGVGVGDTGSVGVTGADVSTFVGLVFITGGVTTSGSGSGKSIYSSTDGFVNEGPGFVGSGTGEGSGVASGKF